MSNLFPTTARDCSFYGLEMKEEADMAIKLGTKLAHVVTGNNPDVRIMWYSHLQYEDGGSGNQMSTESFVRERWWEIGDGAKSK